MPLGDGDIAAILADLKVQGEAVDVVLGGTTVQGILRREYELLSHDVGQQVERVPAVTIKTGSLPGLAIGSALTVGGTSYAVRDFWPGDDGGLTDVVLAP